MLSFVRRSGGLARRTLTLGNPAELALTRDQRGWFANRRSSSCATSGPRLCERRLVAREGLEPSKPLGRQIYSLLRLTASLPRQLAVMLENDCFGYLRPVVPSTELAKGFEPPTC